MQTEQFWTNLYNKNIGKMIAMSFRYVGDKSIAEDLAHDAFLKAIEKSGDFRSFGKIESWLMRINLNTTLDYLRKNQHFMSIDNIFENEELKISESATNEEQKTPEKEITRQEILEAISKLPERQKVVFNLYVFENYTHTKISETLGIGIRSSKRYLSEARTQLQYLLKPTKQKRLFTTILPAIDIFCKTKLRNYELSPASGADLFNREIAQIAPKPSKYFAISAHRTAIIASFGAATIAGITIPAAIKIYENKQQNTEKIITANEKDDDIFFEQESENYFTNQEESLENSELQEPEDIENQENTETLTEHDESPLSEKENGKKNSNHSLKKFEKSGFYGMKNSEEAIIVFPKYTEIQEFNKKRKGWAMVKVFGVCGFIDSIGEEIVKPQYDEIGEFDAIKANLARVRIGNFYGFIDTTGKEVIEVANKISEISDK